jgi:hypothetical protein
MKIIGLLLAFAASLSCFGQVPRPTVYIEPQQGFETYLAAAISKKNVPVDVAQCRILFLPDFLVKYLFLNNIQEKSAPTWPPNLRN